MKKLILGVAMSSMLFLVSCSGDMTKPAISGTADDTKVESDEKSFASIHDAFETKLDKQENDQDEIPLPPEGVFELDYYKSKVGPLATYISSDPGDGQKHPLMIWVVGGWGNGIDEFAWSYPYWGDDQSASAFREAGILMMYPSFRGANGNPGYYETLFGEVDDIAAAYEYAAALPFVDPDRIYLGGHSTGGTRVLLASEYTDKFRAAFAFGPVDEIKYHNTSEFTFDTSDKKEYKMRSPIHWLADIKSPTFIIEGSSGNAKNLRSIERSSKNDNVFCYIVDGADHFSVLAPATKLLADKIVADTGNEPNITITKDELQAAMKQRPEAPYPVMKSVTSEEGGISVNIPAVWEVYDESDDYFELMLCSVYEDDNFWDSSMMYVNKYEQGKITYDEFMDMMNYDGESYQGSVVTIGDREAYVAESVILNSQGQPYYNRVVVFSDDDTLIEVNFYTYEEYMSDATVLFDTIMESIEIVSPEGATQ